MCDDMRLTHYQPVAQLPVCGAYARIKQKIAEGSEADRMATLRIPTTTDLERVDCPKCRQAIALLVDEWKRTAASGGAT